MTVKRNATRYEGTHKVLGKRDRIHTVQVIWYDGLAWSAWAWVQSDRYITGPFDTSKAALEDAQEVMGNS